MRKQHIHKIMIGLVLVMFCTGIFYFQMVSISRAADNQVLHNYWAYENDLVLLAYEYHYVYDTLQLGDQITGLIETSSVYDDIEFFICDDTNFDLYDNGYTAYGYHIRYDAHIEAIDFTIPYTDTWYFVFVNDDSLTDILDYYLERNGDDSPYYNPVLWDITDNYVSLEPDDFIYYSLGTLRQGASISGEYATVFTSDDIGVVILNEYNKDRLILGYEPDYIFLRSGYYRSSFGPIEIPEKGEWFIFFVAAFDYDTITFSFGLEIDKGFPLVGVLIGGGVGVVALAIIIPLSVASSKKKKARMQGPELPGTTPSTQPGPVGPQMYGQAQQPPDSAIQGSNGSTKNFCDKCGMKLLPGAVFCPGCGSPLK